MGKIEFRKAIALFPATSGKRQKTISDPGVVAVVAVFVAVFVEELLQKGGGGSARVTKLIRRRVGSIPHGIVNRDSLC